ncbi:hypothetical protein [Nocardia sienata]|uniref:hypothetical protein n=1 Tax=Nocardia sienata TaxID=248552 RepID=UPI000AAA46D7|nr:hypothetical protein [Nocardia sienata]
MGDQTTTDLPGAAEESAAAPAPEPAADPVSGGAGATVGRVLGWLVFAGGLGAAAFGIGTLQVIITVIGLILACTAGLTLLKLRADGPGPEPEARIAG